MASYEDSIPSLEPPTQFGPEPYSSLRTSGPHLSGFAQHKILGQIYLSLSTTHPTVKTVDFLVEFDVSISFRFSPTNIGEGFVVGTPPR